VRRALLIAASTLVACVSGPPIPDWQGNAKSALDRGTEAYLVGETRVANVEFARARSEIGSTGRLDLIARAELVRCAAQVASLVFDPCAEYERFKADAAAPERAYAEYLAGRISSQDVALLPPQHRQVAIASGDAAVQSLRSIEDPLSRLVATGVLFQSGRASPAAIALAAETASSQGWRRPLLAWLGVQLALAEKAGDKTEAERLRRRIAVAQGKGGS
jgi:hypothetical protein